MTRAAILLAACIALTGCEDKDDAVRVFEGKPPKAYSQAPSVSLHLSSGVAVVPVVAAVVPVVEAVECVILATEFRQWMCSEDGRKILIP